ncbi:NAD-dependent epimerase/dehydratase family protein [Citrobacter freundii]|uniref:NAD-dependent epimerase/dehydratase family protein n=1 Tax=Citrobacter freundii TaxID=546 RepID=UPI002DBBEB08|nr:SDR family oxidoreductase [Citrobacter freundii]MEB6425291.1 SDR family oxidoreductase [Citrobacter freundii]
MIYTVVGSTGFIGKNLYNFLHSKGEKVNCINRGDLLDLDKEYGLLIYCAGYGDCKKSAEAVLEGNVLWLLEIIKNIKYQRLIYLSSTRLYLDNGKSEENCKLYINSNDDRRLFNITKLLAEELCVRLAKNVVIVRPSNVYGLALDSQLFIPMIIKNAIINKKVDMFVSKKYTKDYICVDDLVEVIHKISKEDVKHGEIINVASGVNINAEDIARILIEKTGTTINWHDVTSEDVFPEIDISKLHSLVKHNSRNILDDMAKMIEEFNLNIRGGNEK